MILPLQVTFRGMPSSESLERYLRERAEKLNLHYGRVTACRVVIEAKHRQHHQGNLYHVRIDLTVPGREIVASREPRLDHAHEDVYVAARDAFDAVERRLEEHARKRQLRTKSHEVPPHGRVARIFPADGYGFLETPDGREIYFHRNSVVEGDFDRLEPGDRVRFHEEMGEEGPQASTVRVEGKHHVIG